MLQPYSTMHGNLDLGLIYTQQAKICEKVTQISKESNGVKKKVIKQPLVHCTFFHIYAYSVAITLYKKFMHGTKKVPNKFCHTLGVDLHLN